MYDVTLSVRIRVTAVDGESREDACDKAWGLLDAWLEEAAIPYDAEIHDAGASVR